MKEIFIGIFSILIFELIKFIRAEVEYDLFDEHDRVETV